VNVGRPLVVRFTEDVMQRYSTVTCGGLDCGRRSANGVTPLGVVDENVAIKVAAGGTDVNGKPMEPPKPSTDGSCTPETPLTGAGNGTVVATENAGTGGKVGAGAPVLKTGAVEDPP
jgi:hypothetical protein